MAAVGRKRSSVQPVDISHVWKVSVQMLTGLKFANRHKRVARNINNFKRPSLRVDIYRVRGGGGGDPGTPSTSLVAKGYAGQSWGMRRKQCGVEKERWWQWWWGDK